MAKHTPPATDSYKCFCGTCGFVYFVQAGWYLNSPVSKLQNLHVHPFKSCYWGRTGEDSVSLSVLLPWLIVTAERKWQKAKQSKGIAITVLLPCNSKIISLSFNIAIRQIQCCASCLGYTHSGRFDLIMSTIQKTFANSRSRQTTGKFDIFSSKTMSIYLTAKK